MNKINLTSLSTREYYQVLSQTIVRLYEQNTYVVQDKACFHVIPYSRYEYRKLRKLYLSIKYHLTGILLKLKRIFIRA